MANGEKKSYIDPGVYTNNRRFRLLRCNKRLDQSQTALHLSQPPTLAMFVRSCITHNNMSHICSLSNAGLVPQEAIPRILTGKPSARRTRTPGGDNTRMLAPAASDPLRNFLYQLLRRQGQSDGTLTPASGSQSEIKFRWNVHPASGLRPAMPVYDRPSMAPIASGA